MDVASRCGQAEVSAAVQALLGERPQAVYPSTPRALPAFWQPQHWARPLLQNGHALDAAAVHALGQLLSFARTEGVCAGIGQVKAACTAQSLADFSWDLFDAWLDAGGATQDNWAFTALGLLGNDETARQLTPLIRAWPGEAAHARAVLGLDVLASMGTDTALMGLNGIALQLKFKGLQAQAREKIAAMAQARGLSAQALADRLVPDFGLDEQGTLVLDLGPRQFKLGFDEALKPVVREILAPLGDAAAWVGDRLGPRLKDLPKPKQGDDPDLAQAASTRYKALKKDVATVAAQQVQRFEQAMCQQRRWPVSAFFGLIAHHPLLRHMAQRLVWGVYLLEKENAGGGLGIPRPSDAFSSDGGRLLSCFCVAEDGSLSTADDRLFELPEAPGAGHVLGIGLPHALHMAPADLQAFAGLLADHESLQPFAQLGRDTHSLTDAERAATQLTRWVDLSVPTGQVLGLSQQGWQRATPQGGGWIDAMVQRLPDGTRIELALTPGLITGDLGSEAVQTLGPLSLMRGGLTWGMVDDVTVSELIRSLESLRGM